MEPSQQRPPIQQNYQQQQQQCLRRNPSGPGSSSSVNTFQAQAHIDSSSQDWKAQLRKPPPDNLYKTEHNTTDSVLARGEKLDSSVEKSSDLSADIGAASQHNTTDSVLARGEKVDSSVEKSSDLSADNGAASLDDIAFRSTEFWEDHLIVGFGWEA